MTAARTTASPRWATPVRTRRLNTPDRLNLTAIYRDFVAFATNGSPRSTPTTKASDPPDLTTNLVKGTLDANGKPVIEAAAARQAEHRSRGQLPLGQELSTAANFQQWYRDTANVNVTVRGALLLPRQADGSYVFDSDPKGFYPLDGKGWFATMPVKEALGQSAAGVNDGLKHNFGFSTEVRYFFQYRGGETLTFSGDDDVWVFVNRKLGLDLGGLHPRRQGTLDDGHERRRPRARRQWHL